MNILITAGGTIEKIDDVRNISNFSSGYFSAKIAEECLLSGHTVIYLHAKRAKKPFDDNFVINPDVSLAQQFSKVKKLEKQYRGVKAHVEYLEFQTFDEYKTLLRDVLSKRKIDVAFLAAAVSDYGLAKVHKGKISSEKDELVLRLKKNDKLIKHVKEWSKNHVFQVGFKLLSHVSKDELIETAYMSGLTNKSDMTVANDLQHIRSGKRVIYAVTPERGVCEMKGETMPKELVDFVVRRAQSSHFQTKLTTDKKRIIKYKNEIEVLRFMSALLYRKGLMTPFFKGSDQAHGSIALRVDDGFLITARGSNKKQLALDDIVLITKVDWKKRIITAVSAGKKKASLNVPLADKIFTMRPLVNAIVHTHSFDTKAPTTDFSENPGTVEYAESMAKLIKQHVVVNLKDHGLISVGTDIIDATLPVLSAKEMRGSCYADFPEFYDILYRRYLKTIPTFVELVNRSAANKNVLELAAGTGEVTIPMLKKGLHVHATDLSEGMLKQLKQKVTPQYKQAFKSNVLSMDAIQYDNEFGAVCVRQAMNYVKPAVLRKVYKKVHTALVLGGSFVFNAPNVDINNMSYKDIEHVLQTTNPAILVTESNDIKGKLLLHTQKALVIKEGKQPVLLQDTNKFYLYTKEDFAAALKAAGFSQVTFLSSGLKPYSPKDKTLYCIAKK